VKKHLRNNPKDLLEGTYEVQKKTLMEEIHNYNFVSFQADGTAEI
jgi:hypothetical protein